MAVRIRLVLSLILVTFVFTAHVRAAAETTAETATATVDDANADGPTPDPLEQDLNAETTAETATVDDANAEAPASDPLEQDLNAETTTPDPPTDEAEAAAAAEATTENPNIALYDDSATVTTPDSSPAEDGYTAENTVETATDVTTETDTSDPAGGTDQSPDATTTPTADDETNPTGASTEAATTETETVTDNSLVTLGTAATITVTGTTEVVTEPTTPISTPAAPHFVITLKGRKDNQTVDEAVTVSNITNFGQSFVQQLAFLLNINEDSINIRDNQTDGSVVTIEFDITEKLEKARKALSKLVENGELFIVIERDDQTWEATKLEGAEIDKPIVPKPDFVITLDGDFSKITNEASFKEDFIRELAKKLNISEEFIVIKNVREGSIIVDVDIIDEDAKEKAAKELPTLVANGNLEIEHNGETLTANGLGGKAVDTPIVPETEKPTPQAPVTEPVDPYPLGLNRTDIIVIGVACVICILLIILGIIVCCRECRRRKNKTKFGVNEAEGYYRNVSLEEFNSIPRPHVKYDRSNDEVKYENGRDDFELIKAPEETIDRRKLVRTDINADVGGVDNPVFRKSEIDDENKTTF